MPQIYESLTEPKSLFRAMVIIDAREATPRNPERLQVRGWMT